MDCFNHSNASGIGVCVNCGKAICHDCASLVEGALSCRETCQEAVNKKKHFERLHNQALAKTGKAYKSNGIVYFSIGLMFLIVSVMVAIGADKPGTYIGAALAFFYGAACTYGGLASFKTAKGINKNEEI